MRSLLAEHCWKVCSTVARLWIAPFLRRYSVYSVNHLTWPLCLLSVSIALLTSTTGLIKVCAFDCVWCKVILVCDKRDTFHFECCYLTNDNPSDYIMISFRYRLYQEPSPLLGGSEGAFTNEPVQINRTLELFRKQQYASFGAGWNSNWTLIPTVSKWTLVLFASRPISTGTGTEAARQRTGRQK